MEAEQFSLCWNNFHNNLRTGFNSLLQDEDLVDVTLAAEGRYIKAHKTVLSVCSPYFKELFMANPCKHPIVILQDVNYCALKNLLQFMYQGEVSVGQDEIPIFMRVAETLKVKGLTDSTNSEDSNSSTNNGMPETLNRDSPYMYSDSKTLMKRSKSPKKIIRPMQHIRPIETGKTAKSSRSGRSHSSPLLSKKQCLDNDVHKSGKLLIPKAEPVDPGYEDDYDQYDNNIDVASMLDTSLNESVHPTGSWANDFRSTIDSCSPGTLQCVLGKRGNPRLIVDSHTFFKKSTYKGKSFWYCKHSRTPYKCPAVCWTLNGQIVKWPSKHSHLVIPEPFNPDEDMEVPIERLQEVLLQSSW